MHLADLDASNVAPIASAYTFSLDQLPSYTDFTALFDTYKINRVVIQFEPRNMTMVTTSNGTDVPLLHVITDTDDSTIPASVQEMEQYSTYRHVPATHPLTVSISPNVLVMAYKTAVTTAYSPAKRWIDANDVTTPHYGLKLILEQTAGPIYQFHYSVIVTYYITCKNVR